MFISLSSVGVCDVIESKEYEVILSLLSNGSSGLKWPGREGDQSLQFSVEIKNSEAISPLPLKSS
jgi:hypothetical protein